VAHWESKARHARHEEREYVDGGTHDGLGWEQCTSVCEKVGFWARRTMGLVEIGIFLDLQSAIVCYPYSTRSGGIRAWAHAQLRLFQYADASRGTGERKPLSSPSGRRKELVMSFDTHSK